MLLVERGMEKGSQGEGELEANPGPVPWGGGASHQWTKPLGGSQPGLKVEMEDRWAWERAEPKT